MPKLQLAVIFGGQSSEYSVSLHSAASFLRQIHSENYEMTLIGIDQEGIFYVYEGDIDHIEHDTWKENAKPCAWVHQGVLVDGKTIHIDVAFPILHGKNGEDGCIQGLFELMNIHYVGDDVLSSAISMDKELMHIVCDYAGIPTAPYVCLHQNDEIPSFETLVEKMPLPWFVKPCNAGSSYGITRVDRKEDYVPALQEAWQYDGRGKLLVEQGIDGFEIGCAVMGNDTISTGECDEIELQGSKFFDFSGKYDLKGAAIHCPARISPELTAQAKQLAKDIYRAMNCQGLARVDMFVTPEDKIVLNELNTMPGFTAASRYPTMMKQAGLEFPDLIDQLIDLAMEKEVGVC